jgi:hypothetical protein
MEKRSEIVNTNKQQLESEKCQRPSKTVHQSDCSGSDLHLDEVGGGGLTV